MLTAVATLDDMRTSGRLWKRPDNGVWYVWYYEDPFHPTPKKKTLGTRDEQVAEYRFHRWKQERLEEEKLGLRPRRGITYGGAVHEYLKDFAEGNKEASVNRYRVCLENVGEYIGNDLPLSALSAERLRKYRHIRRQEDISRTTVDFEIGILRTFLNWCIAADWLDDNVADYKHIKPLLKKRQKQSNRRIFTDDELELLLNPPESEYWQLKYQFATLYYTGMRIAELGHLQAKDINLAKREIRIREKTLRIPFGKQKLTKTVSWSPKSHEARVVPIEQRLEPVLREFHEKREENIWQLYFVTSTGVQVTDHLSRRVKAITGKDDVSLHTFRHTHISHALNRWGRNATVVQQWVGHKDLNTTQQYIHVSREDLHREAGKVGG